MAIFAGSIRRGRFRATLRTTGVQLLALDDANHWRKWLEVRPSKVAVDSSEGRSVGIGVFAARTFAPDDVITQFCGEVTQDSSRKKRWLSTWRKNHAILKSDKTTLVCPPSRAVGDVLYAAHFINQSPTPNCIIGQDLVVRASHKIKPKEANRICTGSISRHRFAHRPMVLHIWCCHPHLFDNYWITYMC